MNITKRNKETNKIVIFILDVNQKREILPYRFTTHHGM